MNNNTSRFVFKGYTVNPEKKQVDFFYEINHKSETFHFTDSLIFPYAFSEVSEQAKPFFDNLLLVLGISYWKIFCPTTLETPTLTLSKEQADFWNTVYTKGLGEFFYVNNIDFRGLIKFPYKELKDLPQLVSLPKKKRSIVPIGGGKDGIVVAELLKKIHKPFSTILIYTGVEETRAQEEVVKEIGNDVIRIHHRLDPQITELNKREDTYNGHIPMVAMHSFIELFTAFMYDYTYIVLGNEESANYGNVEYLGETMNHQWSKSLEFEELFQEYIKKYVTNDILLFSILRPFSEIKIAQLFSQHPEYFPHFVSCNKGFTSVKKGQTSWCGKCPKCAFVFVLLTAFLPKEKVINIFGKNLFEDTSLLSLYKELLGLEAFKPFECVGTPEETTLAFLYALRSGEWNDTKVMEFFISHVLPTIKNQEKLEKKLFLPSVNKIPEEFKEILSS